MRVHNPSECVRCLERILRDEDYPEPRSKAERVYAYAKLFEREGLFIKYGFAPPCAIDLAAQAYRGFWEQRKFQNAQWRIRRGE